MILHANNYKPNSYDKTILAYLIISFKVYNNM